MFPPLLGFSHISLLQPFSLFLFQRPVGYYSNPLDFLPPPPALPPPIPLNSPPLDNIVWVTSALIFGIIFHADHLWDLITRGLVLTKVAPLVYSVYGFSLRQIRVFTNQQTHLPVRFQLGRDIALEVAGTPVTLDKQRFQIMAGRMTSLLQLYNSLNLKGLSPVHKEFQFWHFWFLVR